MRDLSDAVREAIIAARPLSVEITRQWREGPEVRAAEAAFAGLERAPPEAAAARAEALFGDSGWAGALIAPLVAALAEHPFFEPPFRLSRDPVRTGAVLLECPAVSVSASVICGREMPRPATIVFPGYVTVTRYIRAGGATLDRWEADPLAPGFTAATAPPCRPLLPVALTDGAVRRCDGRTQAQLPRDAASDLVLLIATVRAGALPLVREHRIADGALIRVASADERASRTEMLLAYLRHAGRADAGARFAAGTRDPAFHTRWAAMREWLGLDARSALPRLSEMAAADPNAEVRAAAARTLATVEAKLACPA